MPKVRVGIIGSGSICRHRHAPEYYAHPDVEIVAFADRVKERAEWCAKKFGGKAYDKWEDVLKLKDVDAVSVCTANFAHAPIAIAALEAGKHVLCEKPMATSDAEAKAMIDAAAKAGKYLMIGHNQRLAPLHVKAKQILQSGIIGKVITFRTSFSHGGPEGWSIEGGPEKGGWFFDKEQAFVGAMGDLGVHKTDLLRWLLGEEIVEVSAFVERLEKGGSVDDVAVCALRTQSGAVGTLTASWTHHPGEDNATIVYGEKGILRIGADRTYPVIVNLQSGENQFFQVGALQTNEAGGQSDTGVIRAFVESILTQTPPEISGEEGRKALAVILACLESAKSGRHVKVAY
jgi:Predicted dehydrogenases and related proteins